MTLEIITAMENEKVSSVVGGPPQLGNRRRRVLYQQRGVTSLVNF